MGGCTLLQHTAGWTSLGRRAEQGPSARAGVQRGQMCAESLPEAIWSARARDAGQANIYRELKARHRGDKVLRADQKSQGPTPQRKCSGELIRGQASVGQRTKRTGREEVRRFLECTTEI